ncbi:MAG: phenylalanine--tRNA ligase subunit beta [Planctomycetota bacterium]
MLVSWKWLSRYVDLTLTHDELVDRLSLSGLNHEGSQQVGDDTVIDLEVTSNRGDCLGHIGVAREIAVLTQQTLSVASPEFQSSSRPVTDDLSIENRFTDACPRFTARVIRGVTIGPSPDWLQQSLAAVGLSSINNVVDATNYVLMECGQPLHAFDLEAVADQSLVVRPAVAGEVIEAIDHKTYELSPMDCVIADSRGALSVAGVMGGASSEVSEKTSDLIIEAAIFKPLTIRRTARRLKLHSPSSFRFERRVDPVGVDWASRRVCELITQLAGGQVDDGVLDTEPTIPVGPPVILRKDRISKLLGMTVPSDQIVRILGGLGCRIEETPSQEQWFCIAPSWRHDLTREVDLIEEVARIHGYDKIPEDAPIPVTTSTKRVFDTATQRVRSILTAAGFSEAMTPSVVTEKLDLTLSPWSELPALKTLTAMLVGSKRLRRSLIPSLLQSRASNFASANLHANLFEIAHVYLPPSADNHTGLPIEQYHLGLVAGDDFFAVKGTLELLCQRLGVSDELTVQPVDRDGFVPGGCVVATLDDSSDILGYLGLVSDEVVSSLKLPARVVAAELNIELLVQRSQLVPQQQPVSAFPSIHRDLNLVVPEPIRWVELASIIHAEGGERLTELAYQETYRNEKQDGPDKKRILFSMELQSQTGTLSGDDADEIVQRIVRRCEQDLDAILMR